MTLHAPSYAGGFASPERGLIDRSLWDGVVGAWCPSLGATGLTVRDNSLHGNDGVVIGMTEAEAWADTPRGMTFGGSGSGDYTDVTINADLQLSGHYTVSVFITWAASTNAHAVSCYDGNGWTIFNIGTTIYFGRYGSDEGSPFVAGPTLVVGTRYHLVMTYNGTTLTAYVDGKSVGTKALSGFTSTANNLNIGRNPNTVSQVTDGTIDSVTIWDGRALSANEVSTFHRLGPGGMYRRQLTHNVKTPAAGRINSLVGVGGGMIGQGGGMIGRGY
mgnify:CR=1 FL=1